MIFSTASSFCFWWLIMALAALEATLIHTYTSASMITAMNTTKPGCPRQCGGLTIPYPFGIGPGSGCAIDSRYEITCNTSYTPPKAFLQAPEPTVKVEVLDITESQLRITSIVAEFCPWNSKAEHKDSKFRFPFPISASDNVFTVIGCNTHAEITTYDDKCMLTCNSECFDAGDIGRGCKGKGCCQTSVFDGINGFGIDLHYLNPPSNGTKGVPFNDCSYAFASEKDRFTFEGAADVADAGFISSLEENVSIVLNWAMENGSCRQAQEIISSYACQLNTKCFNAEHYATGYSCSCLPGYEGNPYLSPGCKDINECGEDPNDHGPCTRNCTNTMGSYICSCPPGYLGDGMKNGTSCFKQHLRFPIGKFMLGMCIGFLSLIIGISWTYSALKKRGLQKLKEAYFRQNGGFLLKQLLSEMDKESIEETEIFSIEQLRVATKNFDDDHIIGKGGSGVVYKGSLSDGRVVAIKKSKTVDEKQIEQFINEVAILTRISHRNVVKILGCCLETEVPILVYEFIVNGTLYEHIHAKGGHPWLSWDNCLRIATEVANALSYMHSAASIPIIHRDVKSTNILLDEYLVAKISDFGSSRLIPLDQLWLSTIVHGTLGYLDPEYYFSSQLTEKSDVYGFGVVLAELLTRENPVSLNRKSEERILATHFVVSLEEGNLFEVLDPELVQEASKEQLVSMSEIVRKCVEVRGEDRPTMKKVAMELEALRKLEKQLPWESKSYVKNNATKAAYKQRDLYRATSGYAVSAPSYSSSSSDLSMLKTDLMASSTNYLR
ncbi:Wall-associated receptor kinase 5-like protein [Drosera capensis]